VITPPAAIIASLAWSTTLPGVSLGKDIMTDFCCATAATDAARAKGTRRTCVNFMLILFVGLIDQCCESEVKCEQWSEPLT
jgi:hypothetical protein